MTKQDALYYAATKNRFSSMLKTVDIENVA